MFVTLKQRNWEFIRHHMKNKRLVRVRLFIGSGLAFFIWGGRILLEQWSGLLEEVDTLLEDPGMLLENCWYSRGVSCFLFASGAWEDGVGFY